MTRNGGPGGYGSTAMAGGSKVITKTNISYLWYLNSINLRTFKIEIPLSRSRTYISSPEPPSFVLWLPNWAQSRRLWLSSRWCSDNVTLEVSWSNSNVTWYRKWSQCNFMMNCRLSTAPFLQFFTLKRAQSKRKKSEIFTQKVPKKRVKTGDPADTDIARKRSKREGYFSRPPKIKFQNTGKHTEVCHTHILLVKISKNPYVT